MHWRNGALWGCCLAALVASCGDDDEAPSPPPPSAPVVQSLTAAVCDMAFRCCTRGEVNYFLGPFYDQNNCQARLVSRSAQESSTDLNLDFLLGLDVVLPNLGALEQATAEGRGTANAGGIQACVAYLQQVPCPEYEEPREDDGKCHPPEPKPEPTPCDPENLFVGLVGEGGACTSGSGTLECAKGLVCRTDPELGVTGRCVKLGDVGAPCVGDAHCRTDLYCALVDGTCREPSKLGEVCGYSDRTGARPNPATLIIRCDETLSCDWLTELCVERCQRGSPCGTDKDCDSDLALVCIGGRCDTLRAEGLPCEEADDCQEGLRCGTDPADGVHRVCVPLLPEGAACSAHSACLSGFCDPLLHKCSPQSSPNGACPSKDDAQCADGRCVHESLSCTDNDDCPITNDCDPANIPRTCGWYCVQVKPDGASCEDDGECESGECIRDFCRTPPLKVGAECDSNSECESGFCGLETTPVCTELPLPIGDRCAYGQQCESLVCFDSADNGRPVCSPGLGEGEFCDPHDPDVEPCNPLLFFCDTVDQPRPACVKFHETGEGCERSEQCRGDCAVVFSRALCSAAVPPKAVTCDGNPQAPGVENR